VFRDKLLECYDHGGKTAFHIGSATSIYRTVTNIRFERVRAPFVISAWGHHVGVTCETQHRTGVAASGIQVADVPEGHGFAHES
jgi:hypothetical protein